MRWGWHLLASTMLLLLVVYIATCALALPSRVNKASQASNLSGHARREAPPKSAKLAVSKLSDPNTPFWTADLAVNGQKATVMLDTGSADLCVSHATDL